MTLCHDLERMPVSALHCTADLCDEACWYIRVEQIAHRIDENPKRFAPAQRLIEFLRNKPKIEAALVRMASHPTKALGKSLSVTMLTAGTDLGTAADGVPSGVRPFYWRCARHDRPIGEIKAKRNPVCKWCFAQVNVASRLRC